MTGAGRKVIQQEGFKNFNDARLYQRQCQPMPLHEENKKGIIYVALYEDNNLLNSKTEAIYETVELFKRTCQY